MNKWIDSFDSQNVTDFFNMSDYDKQDPKHVSLVTKQFKNQLSELDTAKLSPNLQPLNEALQIQKNRMTNDKTSMNNFSKRALSMTVANGPAFSTMVRGSVGGFNKSITRDSPSKMGKIPPALSSRIHLNRTSIESGVGIAGA